MVRVDSRTVYEAHSRAAGYPWRMSVIALVLLAAAVVLLAWPSGRASARRSRPSVARSRPRRRRSGTCGWSTRPTTIPTSSRGPSSAIWRICRRSTLARSATRPQTARGRWRGALPCSAGSGRRPPCSSSPGSRRRSGRACGGRASPRSVIVPDARLYCADAFLPSTVATIEAGSTPDPASVAETTMPPLSDRSLQTWGRRVVDPVAERERAGAGALVVSKTMSYQPGDGRTTPAIRRDWPYVRRGTG